MTEHDPRWPTVPDVATDATSPGPATIRFVAQPTMGELVWHQAELARRAAPLIDTGPTLRIDHGFDLPE